MYLCSSPNMGGVSMCVFIRWCATSYEILGGLVISFKSFSYKLRQCKYIKNGVLLFVQGLYVDPIMNKRADLWELFSALLVHSF